MTVRGWLLCGILSVVFMAIAIGVAYMAETKMTTFISLVIGVALCLCLFFGLHWYYNNTEAGQRAFKSQQSNLEGGLYRTVTVYGYSGEEIQSWSGKFDVTENDQETWFDIDGRRVIIQGGIVINEEQANPNEGK